MSQKGVRIGGSHWGGVQCFRFITPGGFCYTFTICFHHSLSPTTHWYSPSTLPSVQANESAIQGVWASIIIVNLLFSFMSIVHPTVTKQLLQRYNILFFRTQNAPT